MRGCGSHVRAFEYFQGTSRLIVPDTGRARDKAVLLRTGGEPHLSCVRPTFTAADEKPALNLCQRGVSLEQLRRAIWLGCACKYMAMLNGQTQLPITSLAYFATLIDEGSARGPCQLLGVCTGQDGGMGEALVTNPEIRTEYGCRSPATIVTRNDLSMGQPTRLPHFSGIVPHFERNQQRARNEMMETK